MFGSDISRPSAIGSYIGQLLAVALAVAILSLPVFWVYDRLTRLLAGAKSGDMWDAGGVMILPVLGLALGFWLGRRFPWMVDMGTWVWVLPAVVFSISLARDWSNFAQHGEALWIYFRSLGDDEGLNRALLTDPALAALGYSLGMLLARRYVRAGKGREKNGPVKTG